MTYQDTLHYLFSQLPMFQRIGPAAYKASLDNTHALINYLQNPEKAFASIHIAGTNGKGSVAHMLASVFQAHGMKTGLATSPHLKDFRERIKIDGNAVSKEFVTAFVKMHRAFFEKINPSFFEMTMAMTFDYFATEKVDIAVIETGMGGRLDSSNVILPELSVITNIGLDHVRFLGSTLPDIAREKAGIIKKDIPVLIGKRQGKEVQAVFAEIAARLNAPLTYASDTCSVSSHRYAEKQGVPGMEADIMHEGGKDTFFLDLTGIYQLENLLTAVAATDILKRNSNFRLYGESIKKGLSSVVKRTGIQGRWQVIGEKPLTICDTAHNREGLQHIVAQLQSLSYRQLRIVFGMVEDKDPSAVLVLLPADAVYYFCKPAVPRGMDAKKLASDASFWGLRGSVFDSVCDALTAAQKEADGHDLIFVGGSTFVVAEVL